MASSNQFIVSEMPLSFYDVPDDAPALFSTRHCTVPKRQLIEPYPPTVARSNLQTDVRIKASLLRQEFPSIVHIVRTPTNWTHLYFFFDGVDIWIEGAAYLYYVLEYIGTQNKTIEAEIAQDCKAEITNWAINWVNCNKDLVATVPISKDLVSTFNTADWNEVKDLRTYEFVWLRTALDRHRNLLVEALESQSLEARPRSTLAQGVQSHPVIAHTYANTEPGHPVAQLSHVKIGQGVLVADRPELGRDRAVPVRQIRHLPQKYDQFMEDQRYLAATNSDRPGDFVKFRNDENNCDGFTRLRSWSNDSSRSMRGSHREPVRHAKISYYRPKYYPRPIMEREILLNTARASPQRHTPQKSQSTCAGPIYVHNSQQVSPSSDRDRHRVSSDGDHGMTQSSNRNCINSVSGWTGRPNDARLLASLEVQRGDQGSQDSSRALQRLEGHPRVQTQGPSTTIFYTGVPKLPSAIDSQRTLYVAGVDKEIFISHELKAMMSECGTVESIRYLYANACPGGPSFVTFTEEGALPRAIQKFNGHIMQSGRVLAVDYPRKSSRHRSGSQLSQKSFSPHERPPFTARREFEARSTTRQAIVNKHAAWNRELNYQGHLYNRPQSSTNSSTAQIPLETPLTVGFESQIISTSQPSIMGEPVHRHMQTVAAEVVLSSISEVMQHRSALNRLCGQNPLEPRENYPNCSKMTKRSNTQMQSSSKHNANTKESGEEATLNIANRQDESRLVSRRRKENVPMRTSSNVGVISATPNKESCNIVSSNCLRMAGSGKHKKKPSKHNISKRQVPTASPTKAQSEQLLSGISIEREKEYNGAQGADLNVVNNHAQAGGSLTNFPAKSQTNSETAAASPASCVQLDSLNLSEKVLDLGLREGLITKQKANNKKKKTLSKNDTCIESSLKDTALCLDVVLADSFSTRITDSTEYLTTRSTSTSFSDDFDRKPNLRSGRSDSSISARDITKLEKSNSETSICSNDKQNGSRLSTQTSSKRSTATDRGNSTSSNWSGHKPYSVKPREKERQQSHLKKASDASITSDRSWRVVDSKLFMASRKNGDVKGTAGVTSSSNVSDEICRTEVEKNKELSAIGILADLAQWPALGPVKSPQSSIADGKHHPLPLLLPQNGRSSASGNRKSLDTLILPAVPFIKPRRLSFDSMGRVPWPFVKKCSGK